MCWAAATISKQCSVLCFAMAVFISQKAWLEKRTRAMQQLHLQSDLTYQVCSQQFKNAAVWSFVIIIGGSVERSWRTLPGSCGISRPACWVCHICRMSAVWANLSGYSCWMHMWRVHWQRSCFVKIDFWSLASALHITAGFRHVKGYVASLGIP